MERADQLVGDIDEALKRDGDQVIWRYVNTLAALRAVWKSRRQLQEQVAQLRLGGREMGRYLVHLNGIALDVTGMHDVIDEDGDGDWGAVWDNVAELGVMAKAAARYAEDAKSTYRSLESSRDRVAELEAFVADIACHGLRADLNPTMNHSTPEKYADGMLRYLRSVDASLRAAARRFVPDADRPHSAGRPIPAPKVEIVADPETELGVLLAQQDREGGAQ